MKHVEPMPAIQKKKLKPQQRRRKRPGWPAFLSITTVVVTLGFILNSFFHPLAGDHLSDIEKTQIAKEFAEVTELRLAPIPSDQISSAINTMGLDQQQRAALEMALGKASVLPQSSAKPDAVRMMWLELSDFASQDGDSVSISSAGYQATVPLLNAPSGVAVPVNGSQSIQVTGVHDGGGGITLGIMTGVSGVIRTVLVPGQTISLPGTL